MLGNKVDAMQQLVAKIQDRYSLGFEQACMLVELVVRTDTHERVLELGDKMDRLIQLAAEERA